MKDLLRDRRTLFVSLFLPIIIYPVLLIGISQLTIIQLAKIEREISKVVIIGEELSALKDKIKITKGLELVFIDQPEPALSEGKIQAIVKIPKEFNQTVKEGKKAKVEILADLSNEKSESAKRKLEKVLEQYRTEILTSRLEDKGLTPEFAIPIETVVTNVASAKKMGGKFLGIMLPYFLIIMILLGAAYPAMDLTAGEKERKTMETLLVSPASRAEIVFGKFATVFTFSMLSAIFNMLSMTLTFSKFFPLHTLRTLRGVTYKIDIYLSPETIVLVLFLIIPMGIIFSGITMSVSSLARSYKEAANYISPLMLICLMPAMVSLLPGFEISYFLSLIPIVNIALLFKQMMLGTYHLGYITLTFFSTIVYAYLALRLTTNLFQKEEILLQTSEEISFDWKRWLFPKKKVDYPSVGQIFLLFFLSIALLYYIGSSVQEKNIKSGLIITEFILILLPTILFVRRSGLSISETLNLRKTTFPTLGLALVAGFCTLVTAYALFFLQNLIFPAPQKYFQLFEKAFTMVTLRDKILMAFIISLTPGICEEAMFRGFVLSGMVPRFGRLRGVIFTALLFALFHLDPYRTLAGVYIGLILGYIVVRTGSIFPAMVLHATNNLMAYLLPQIPHIKEAKWLQEGSAPPIIILVLATVSLIGVLSLVPPHPLAPLRCGEGQGGEVSFKGERREGVCS